MCIVNYAIFPFYYNSDICIMELAVSLWTKYETNVVCNEKHPLQTATEYIEFSF